MRATFAAPGDGLRALRDEKQRPGLEVSGMTRADGPRAGREERSVPDPASHDKVPHAFSPHGQWEARRSSKNVFNTIAPLCSSSRAA